MKFGPLQLIAIGFDQPDFQGQILAELDAVRGRGVIRLIDLLFVSRNSAGEITLITDTDLGGGYGTTLARLAGLNGTGATAPTEAATSDSTYGINADDVRAMIDTMALDTAVALVLFEHNWAGGLAEAIQAAGGYLIAQGILTRDAMVMVGQELVAIAEAEQVIAATEAVKGAAVLDTLAFTEAAEAAQAMMADSIVTSSIAAETLQTLMAVGVVDDTEVETAILALVEAGLVDPDLVAAALDQADAEMAVVEAAFAG